ncbi:MAG TPA: hypothetical protein VFG73_06615 [Rhodanobacteraceae bacterium]|nr:hypothetical protein [Rhodanobacteraceae bacterium]
MFKTIIPWAGLALAIVLVLLAAFAGVRQWRWHRRERMLRALVDGADQLEGDIRECRTRLQQAHAAVSVSPQVPAAGGADARVAVDDALRDLLAHRLWIRDHAEDASQQQLAAAVEALSQARQQIDGQLSDLGDAQRELAQVLVERDSELGPRDEG